MSGRAPFNAKEHIAAFNKIRRKCAGKPIKKDLLTKLLKENKILSNREFCSELVKEGVLMCKGDEYTFVNPDSPIHYNLLNSIYVKYYNRIRSYSKTATLRKTQRKAIKDKRVQESIKLLKEYGYEIYAPVGSLFTKV